MSDHRLKKFERLKSRKSIGRLFEKGKTFSCFPLLVKYGVSEAPSPLPLLRAGFTVPKRSFRRAVDRNRIKRQMKEAYRRNKNQFYLDGQTKVIDAMFIYTAKKASDFKIIEKASLELIKRLSNLSE